MADTANDVNPSVKAETTTPDSSTGENNLLSTDNSTAEDFVRGLTGAPVDSDERGLDKANGVDSPKDSNLNIQEKESTEQADSEKEKSNRAISRKEQLNLEIRSKVAERNALRDEIAALSRHKYEMTLAQDIPTVETLMDQVNPNTGDYYTRVEAENLRLSQRLDAMERQKEFDSYVERVTDSRIQLSNEANQVVRDFPVFDPESQDYDPELTQMADEIMAAQLVTDKKTGQLVGSRVSPYQVYSVIAKAKMAGETRGKTSGRKSALEMMNNVDFTTTTKGPSSSDGSDPFLEGLLGE